MALTQDEINHNKDIVYNILRKWKIEGLEEFYFWLGTKTDYFESPASLKFHNNYEGGLVEHSLKVMDNLEVLNTAMKGKLTSEEIEMIGLFHDLCKVNYYAKNILHNGKQSTSIPYQVEDKLPVGHGEKSIYLLSKFFDLSPRVACCIRWHMALYDQEFSKYENILKKEYPEVYLTYFADHLSCLFNE